MTKLNGTSIDFHTLQTMRAEARAKHEEKQYADLTYLLGEVDRKRGTKGFNPETVVIQTTQALVAQFKNAAEDQNIQADFNAICAYKSTQAFYESLLPVPLTEQEYMDTFNDAISFGCTNIKDFISFFEKAATARFNRAHLIATVKAWQDSLPC